MAEDSPVRSGQDGSGRWKGLLQLGLVVAVVLVALYFMRAPQLEEIDVVVAEGAAERPRVTVVQPEQSAEAVRITLTGEVRLQSRVAMKAEVFGRVVSVSPKLRNGASFKAGETLLTIDPRDFEIEIRAARANAQAQLARKRKHELQGQLDRAEFERRNPGQSVPAIVERQPQIDRFEHRHQRMLARVDAAELALSKTRYSLPFDGKVISSSVGVGEILGPATVFGGAYAREAIGIEAPISLDDLAQIGEPVGREATVRTGDGAFPAAVERVSSIISPRSRMSKLFLAFADSVSLEAIPPPGAFIQVAIDGPAHENAFLLPEAAEQHDGTVWVVDDGVLRSVSPDTLGRAGTGWIVAAFDAGDGVVLGTVAGAKAGLAVEASPVESAAGGDA